MRHRATGLAALAVICAGAAQVHAGEFTAADVLGWDVKQQNWYFETSIVMAVIIASQSDEAKATCIDDWYLSSDAAIAEGNTFIRSQMKKFEGFHPGGVILAVLQHECGSLNFSQ